MYKKTLTDDLPANVFYRLFFTSFPVVNVILHKLYIKRFILNAFSDFSGGTGYPKQGILASNGIIHDDILRLLAMD